MEKLYYCDSCDAMRENEDACPTCGAWVVDVPIQNGEVNVPALHWSTNFKQQVIEAFEKHQS